MLMPCRPARLCPALEEAMKETADAAQDRVAGALLWHELARTHASV